MKKISLNFIISLIFISFTLPILAQDETLREGGDQFWGVPQGIISYDLSPQGTVLVVGRNTPYAIIKTFDIHEPSKEIKILHPDDVNLASFTPDGKKTLSASKDGTVILYDIQKKLLISIHSQRRFKYLFTSAIGKHVLINDQGKIYLWEERLNSNPIWHPFYECSNEVRSAQISPNGRILTIGMEGGEVLTWDLVTGRKYEREHDKSVTKILFSKDSRKLLTFSEDKAIRIGFSLSEDSNEIDVDYYILKMWFSPDTNKVLLIDIQGDASILDIKEEEITKVFSEKNLSIKTGDVTPFSNYFVLGTTRDQVILMNFYNNRKRVIRFSHYLRDTQFTPDGKNLILISVDGYVKIVSLESNQSWEENLGEKVDKLNFNSFLNKAYIELNEDTLFSFSFSIVPTPPILPVIPMFQDPNTLQRIQAISQQVEKVGACSGKFDAKIWEKFVPNTHSLGGAISSEWAFLYLMKLQKIGGINLPYDYGLINSLLQSEMALNFPGAIHRILQNTLSLSNVLYEKLIKKLRPQLLKDFSDDSSLNCQTEDEQNELVEISRKYFLQLKNRYNSKSEVGNWKVLYPLVSLLKKLPKSLIEDDFMDHIAFTLSENASEIESIKGVFISKIYKFSYEFAKIFFAIPRHQKSTLAFVRKPGEATPVILSTEMINKNPDTKTKLGFYALKLNNEKVSIPYYSSEEDRNKFSINRTYSWESFEKNFSAELEIRALTFKQNTLVPQGMSPSYIDLWKDGILTGLIVTGTSLRDKGNYIMKEFARYYRNQGFTVDENAWTPINVPNFLEEKIKGGELDYFVKEAHSDGDDTNIFRMDVKGRLVQGMKITGDRGIEKIYLIFPESESAESTNLSNHTFGEWIRKRKEAKGTQFVYFNTSCSSFHKAICEIEATGCSLLLDIPSCNAVTEFCSFPENAENILLTAFREGKTYSEIRRDLCKNESYRTGKGNSFIFPDDNKYQEMITDIVRMPLYFNQAIYKDGVLQSEND